MEKVALGNTCLKVSRIGMGVMPIGPNQLSLPLEEGAAIVKYALEKGIDFLDTAQYYHTYSYIREAMKGSSFEPIISSKSLAPDYSGMMKAIEEARAGLDMDIIDIFLLHEIRSGDFEKRLGAWEALNDAKAKGLIKAIGISTHNIDVTDEISTQKECDVVFPLINYAGLGIRKGSLLPESLSPGIQFSENTSFLCEDDIIFSYDRCVWSYSQWPTSSTQISSFTVCHWYSI